MIRTLTSTGVQKIGRRFVDSIDHAAYTLNGEPQTIPLFRKSADDDEIRIYIYFDDTFLGDVAQVELIDTDGDEAIAYSLRRRERACMSLSSTISQKWRSRKKMEPYEKVGWIDHIIDIISGKVIQEGTPVSQKNMNHMDEGIFINRQLLMQQFSLIEDLQREIIALKEATSNNIVGNVFTVNFPKVDSVAITSGIYDAVLRKIYV